MPKFYTMTALAASLVFSGALANVAQADDMNDEAPHDAPSHDASPYDDARQHDDEKENDDEAPHDASSYDAPRNVIDLQSSIHFGPAPLRSWAFFIQALGLNSGRLSSSSSASAIKSRVNNRCLSASLISWITNPLSSKMRINVIAAVAVSACANIRG